MVFTAQQYCVERSLTNESFEWCGPIIFEEKKMGSATYGYMSGMIFTAQQYLVQRSLTKESYEWCGPIIFEGKKMGSELHMDRWAGWFLTASNVTFEQVYRTNLTNALAQ